jgi:hypothetical protein
LAGNEGRNSSQLTSNPLEAAEYLIIVSLFGPKTAADFPLKAPTRRMVLSFAPAPYNLSYVSCRRHYD